MILLLVASFCIAGFVFTGTLWTVGFASSTGRSPGDRINRMRGLGETATDGDKGGGAPRITLRKRAAVSLGGVTLVSARMAADWVTTLERAGLSLTPREYFMLRVVVGAVPAVVLAVVLPIPLLALLAIPLGYGLVGFWVKRRINSRRAKLEQQLVEVLQMMSSGLRAGFGMLQAIEGAAEQIPAPLSIELRRLIRDTAVGASLEQALEALNERVGSPDFDIVVTAIMIQRQAGGNLAEILDNVSHTMRERERIHGEIKTLTSQQRLTGYVIAGIPIGLGAMFTFINPEYMTLLFTEPLGRMMVGAAVTLELIGFMVIQKIVNIEV